MYHTFFIHSSVDGHLGSANIFLSSIDVPGMALGTWAKSRAKSLCPFRYSFLKLAGSACCLPLQFQLGTCIQAIFLPATRPLHVTFLYLKCSLEPLYLTVSDSPQLTPPGTAAPHPGRQSTPRLLGYFAHSQSFCFLSLSHSCTHLTFSLHVYLHHYLSTFLSH